MKTRQNLRLESPSRKSPRLSFSAASSVRLSAQAKSRPKTVHAREDDAWALSLHVVEQLPLKICHPSREEDKSFRRSSRFTTNKYRTPLPKRSSRPTALPALVLAQLRRSPRLSSSYSAPALTIRNGKNVGSGGKGSKKRCRTEDGEGGGRIGKKVKVGLNIGGLRRSLRLNGGENGNLKAQLLALPEPGSKSVSKSCFSEKCLRSSTVLVRVGDEKEKVVSKSCAGVNEKCLRSRKRALVKSPESSEKKVLRSAFNELASVQKSSSSTEKCLRSRTVKMYVGNEQERAGKSASKISSQGKECGLIEFRQASETRDSMRNLRRSRRLNQEGGESLKFEMLVLPEKSASSSKKCVSSGAYGVKPSEKNLSSRGAECHLIEFPEASETRNSLRMSTRLNQERAERPKVEMLALPEKNASTSKKSLSSGACCFKLSEKSLSSAGTKCSLIEFPKASETGNISSRLRKSTRLNQEGVESSKFEMLSLPEKSDFSSKKSLRSSACGVKSNEKCSSSSAYGVKSNEKCLMHLNEISDFSSKESLSPSARIVKSNEKCLMHLNEKSDFSSKKSLSSSVWCVKSNEKYLMHPKIESDKDKNDSELISEKGLRSRKVQFRGSVDEVDENKTASIEEQHSSKNESKGKTSVKSEKKEKEIICCFIGEPIPEEEAQKKWGWRYELKSKKKGKSWKINADEEDEIILNVDCHYAQAKVGNCILDIGDCVFVKGEERKKHVGRILEFFKTMEGEDYFRVQWFFRAEDTVLKDAASFHDKRRLFYSTLMNDNILDCIISKVNIVQIPPRLCLKSNLVQSAAFYYDMEYCLEYSTFRNLVKGTSTKSQSFLSNLKYPNDKLITLTPSEVLDSLKPELALLDLYSGCGGMSTGLCVGSKLSSINLVTKWAIDFNSSACESLKLNHPETQVRNESADDFLELLRQWEQLCKLYVCDLERTLKCGLEDPEAEGCLTQLDTEVSCEEFEVSRLVDICYGDLAETGKRGLHFKVRWKGYGPNDDTWEPIEGLSNCEERIQEFVRKGFNLKIIPLPGDVDVICGGPPCQGISGYNRYRNFDSPLDDERNRQIVVFMDIVEFLKPKYVLMENVVDIIRFNKASLGRYALSRLVHMKYQARLGTMASGCYGLPQFRLRVFIWGAHPSEMLPPFPLPTHDVVVKYWPPPEFERNVVAYDEGQPRSLEEAIVLRDSISDLPAVTNDENREEMLYEKPPDTEFQSYIRLSKYEMMGILSSHSDSQTKSPVLYDHRPLQLCKDDYLRVSQIPHRKGANFRDLPGIIIGEDNVARHDPTKVPVMLPTGKPLVPDCVLSFEQGKSRKPYGRLWWDETVSTVVTFPHIRAMAVLHPEQDRRLTLRECARLQGFPDYYKFCGTIKERYCQIGNAVSIPVARALGYALGMAYKKAIGDEPLMMLPQKFSSLRPSINEVIDFGT